MGPGASMETRPYGDARLGDRIGYGGGGGQPRYEWRRKGEGAGDEEWGSNDFLRGKIFFESIRGFTNNIIVVLLLLISKLFKKSYETGECR